MQVNTVILPLHNGQRDVRITVNGELTVQGHADSAALAEVRRIADGAGYTLLEATVATNSNYGNFQHFYAYMI